MGSFAGVAMLLAGIGLYGALSYSVASGIASSGPLRPRRPATHLVHLVLGEGLFVVAPGMALGVLGAVVFARLMRGCCSR